MRPDDLTKLHTLLERLTVPETRRDLRKPANVRWLLRNIGISNAKSAELTESIRLLIMLHRRQRKSLV